MTCGSCPHTDGLCYTSMPPQCRCSITGKHHYYSDECDCADDIVTEELEKFKKLLNEPKAIVAFNYDSNDAPLVASTDEEVAGEFLKPMKLPLYGECERVISVNPNTGIDVDEIDKFKPLLETTAMYETKCLVCDAGIPVHYLGGGRQICSECKKTIKFIKERFKKELESYEM